MSRTAKIGMAIGALVLILFLTQTGTYNSLQGDREKVRGSWSDVESALQRRSDLIPNLVETVKGYVKHERGTLEAVTKARAQVAGASGINQRLAAHQALGAALGRLLVVVERYPQLKASANFQKLQFELSGTENRINVARVRYNQAVRQYNTRIKRLPTAIWASWLGFKQFDYFKAQEGAKKAPQVKF